MNTAAAFAGSRTVVIKIGSALLVDGDRGIRQPWLAALAEDIAALRARGKNLIVVTSGSIALGRKAMGISASDRPSSIPLEAKQAAAAIGQIALMEAYLGAFAIHDIKVAQILLTPADTENRRSHLNARATLHALLAKGVLPVINENDTVSTAEIRFGDNDRLASRVAQMIGADMVVQLSTTDGLYTADPRIDPSADHIPLVEKLSADHVAMAEDAVPGLSTGGMRSKIEAARIATESGVHMAIAKGNQPHALMSACEGDARSTLFLASGQPRTARQKWILAHVKPKGAIILDDGACRALADGKSLLPAGITRVEGDFDRADAVQVKNPAGSVIGIGLSSYSADDTIRIAGRHSDDIADILGYSRGDELIHRDDLALA